MRLTCLLCGFVAALALVAAPMGAEVIHVRDYILHEPRDRKVLFVMAVTPDQDVLSWTAKLEGKWRLTRVRGWLEKQPMEQTVDVPGWTRADLVNALSLHAELFVTTDGNFAVAIAIAIWSRSAGQGRGRSDSIVSVVDLREFKVVTSIHPPGPPSEVWSYYLGRGGQLVLRAGTNGSRLLLLTLPDLAVKDQCGYSVTGGNGRGGPTVVDRKGTLLTPSPVRDDGDCAALVERNSGGTGSFQQFLAELEDSSGCPVDHNPPQPCRSRFTRDGQFEAQSREKHHLSAWNRNYVIDELGVNILSLKTGEQVGTINETTRDTVNSRFADQNGRDYLLVLAGGTRLKTYEIIDKPSAKSQP